MLGNSQSRAKTQCDRRVTNHYANLNHYARKLSVSYRSRNQTLVARLLASCSVARAIACRGARKSFVAKAAEEATRATLGLRISIDKLTLEGRGKGRGAFEHFVLFCTTPMVQSCDLWQSA